MPAAERRADRGRRQAQRTLVTLGEELRQARVTAGLSQRQLAAASGARQALVSLVERGQATRASVLVLATLFAVLGQRLSVRPYPDGSPLRDEAHARLLARFRDRLPAGATMRTEVPVGIPGDGRAWDAEVGMDGARCTVEAETALGDLQAVDRRIALKMADGQVDHVLLLVADTHRNRRVLREFRHLLVDRYPLDTRAIMIALRAGRCPGASGIAVL